MKEGRHDLILVEERDGIEWNPAAVDFPARACTDEDGGFRALVGCIRMFSLIRTDEDGSFG
jgi:hypothetical protein